MTAALEATDDRPPNLALWGSDYLRGMTELGLLPWAWPLLARAPRGDGHPVLVLPGLGAGDHSTAVLRRYLGHLGYRAHGWGLGTNLGLTARVVAGLPARLEELQVQYGTAVSLIGWSLGGVYARRLARQLPASVRQVITLAGPICLRDLRQSNSRPIYKLLSRIHVEELSLPLEAGLGPLPVPATSIYSRLDGIVAWRTCLDAQSTYAENIEVRSAHLGFGYSAAVLYAVADRLAQPRDAWEPFRPPGRFRLAYPAPARREEGS